MIWHHGFSARPETRAWLRGGSRMTEFAPFSLPMINRASAKCICSLNATRKGPAGMANPFPAPASRIHHNQGIVLLQARVLKAVIHDE